MKISHVYNSYLCDKPQHIQMGNLSAQVDYMQAQGFNMKDGKFSNTTNGETDFTIFAFSLYLPLSLFFE